MPYVLKAREHTEPEGHLLEKGHGGRLWPQTHERWAGGRKRP